MRTTDVQVPVMCDEMHQCASKGSEETDCKLIDMNVNNTGWKIFKTQLCKMSDKEETMISAFVGHVL